MIISTLSGSHPCMIFSPQTMAQGYHADRKTLAFGVLRVMVPLSLSACRNEELKTRWISWGPSDFFNLNNCSHLKLEGSIMDLATVQGAQWLPVGTVCDSPWFPSFTISGVGTANMVSPSGQDSSGIFPFYERRPADDSVWSYSIRWKDAYTVFFSWAQDYGYLTRAEVNMVRFNKTFSMFYQRSSGRIDVSLGETATETIDRYFNAWDIYQPCYSVSASTVNFGAVYPINKIVKDYLTKVNGPLADKIIPRESVTDSTWEELAYQTIIQYDTVDVNGLAYIADFVKLRLLLKSLKTIIDLSEGEVNPKALAKLFLAWHYGAKLTILDTAALLSAQRSWSWQHRYDTQKRSASLGLTDTYGNLVDIRYAMYAPLIDRNYFKLGQCLHALDLDLTLENIWDLIPFSFVVDWFFNVSTLLDRIDHISILKTLDVACVGFSTKYQKQFDVSVFGPHVQGGAVVTKYDRWYRKEPVYPRILLSKSTNPVRHVLEGSALIIASL